MDAIRWQGNSLALLDQTRLPVEEVWNTYTDYRKVADAIRRLVVRGAPAIGVAAAYALCLAAMEYKGQNPEEFQKSMAAASAELAASRPTAVNLFWALDRMGLALGAAGCGAEALPILIREAEAIHREDVAMNRAIGAAGAAIVPHGARILTHCNAGAIATGGYGTALGVVRSAFTQGKVEMVYCDETRPLLQGARLTAWELVKDGIPATLITDNMAASLMAQGKIDLVLLGCDRMAANGDFANKIGTYGVAVLAHYHGIPFYSVLPSSTIDLSIPDGSHIPIEQREASEVTHFAGVRTAPEGVGVYNPAFDVTPHRLLTGIITEKGVIHPPFAEQLAERFG
ncbi:MULTISPECIES: S-methyl-5-thioribose-1-phosphate isomerase [Intestinimonas]|jgi:methylthioribose-1-phosphate isomerase|uniref:Methylthioribose-1-phosphate isomerase n=1 Tax=Intestinimonas massiliensis (ex Afouda et al. 2020) TaxID=1673721 RepID=A0AAW5JPT2_9FIRM|nr:MULTISPECIES: S-methyl-5-thioribose-1-phosphate isomerase [Intestinimonas]MBS6282381.1 S-methyl-5-thioribose-1-phosphate isomerase [Oscillospiraceae bacterium]CUQ11229.1 methylthioribose-1-phosphate isomerase MtnA [Flavonifractor plautii]SCI95599.1 Methylthioribose-1-phosphate isomerase [uncultured Flavonifractor sp.]MCG4528315.1 S-methyl-5-thioribose-1-phosphate isomerase [Intestinimonas massiliensis (ex Afouda et al. 2020)]MCI5563117.1 S-methyl-5-thioribose-1-phosphate isomerase [Intestin